MGIRVGVDEGKMHLPRLLGDVALGDTVTITKHGKPIAKIVLYHEARWADRRHVIELCDR